MILQEKIRHSNDRSFTYARLIFPGLLHRYLKLPGNYEYSCQTTILTRDMRKLDMDWLLYVTADNERLFQNILINVEQQTTPTNTEKMEDIAEYRDYSKTLYGLPVLSVILTTIDPKTSLEYIEITESDILKPIYIYFSPEEVKERLNNLKNKVENNEKLNEDETLDIAFLPMFVEPAKGKWITDEVCRIYREASFENELLRNDISHIIEVMINKYFENPKQKDELLKMTIDEIRDQAINELLKPERKQIQELNEKLEKNNKELEKNNKELEKNNKELNDLKNNIQNAINSIENTKENENTLQILNSLLK